VKMLCKVCTTMMKVEENGKLARMMSLRTHRRQKRDMTLIHFGEGSNGLSTCNVLCIYESSIVNNGSIYDSE